MSTTSKISKNYTLISGYISLSLGLIVLSGWLFNIPILKFLLTGFDVMKINSSLAFVFLGLALISLHLNKKNGIFFFGICTALIGFITLIEYTSGLNLGIDKLLTKENADIIGINYANKMSMVTALNFILLGGNVILKFNHKKKSDLISLFVFFNSFLTVIGYLFEVREFFNIGGQQVHPMTIYTSLLFLITSTGIIYKFIEEGYFKLLISETTANIIFKKIILIILLSFPIIGFIIIKGRQLNYYDWPFAFGLNQITTTVISTVFIYYFANLFYHEEISKEENRDKIATEQKKYFNEMKKIQKTLEEKTQNLEKINKLMIGRELTMIELKKEILSLKEQLPK